MSSHKYSQIILQVPGVQPLGGRVLGRAGQGAVSHMQHSRPPALRARGNLLGASKITATLYCNCLHLYWADCVICSIDLR